MKLVPYTDADRWLTEALETDPAVMAGLGGPRRADEIPDIHRRRVAGASDGDWVLRVVPDPADEAVGYVAIWRSEWQGKPISEAGWMILPPHQGRGHAGTAMRLLIERARTDGRWGDIHAFPGVANAASNALCRRLDFMLRGEVEVDYAGRTLRCNHWVLPA